MDTDNISQRRAKNLKAMRSAPSLALAVAGMIAMFCATVFYDNPITKKPVSFAEFRVALNDTVQWAGSSITGMRR